MPTTVLVVAKAPIAGRVKTRLCPPCSAVEAAWVAEAALCDTLDAVAVSRADRRLLVLDGEPGAWLPEDFEVVSQVPGDLGTRLDAAWSHVEGPAVQIGMDTPQITGALLDDALGTLERGADAVLGPALDGGWWLVGLASTLRGVFRGVPMSAADTGARQLERLRALGLDVTLLPTLRDMDTFADALAIAAQLPGSRTAHAVRHRVAALA